MEIKINFHKLPIIARDISVFREVAGEHVFYFEGQTPQAMADAIEIWLTRDTEGKAPQSVGVPFLTWRESAQQLLNKVGLHEADYSNTML